MAVTTRACSAAYTGRVDVEMRHLRALIAVAEELNFTRAAERLHLTQQALSGQIRQLEQRVGTRLVERDTRRVALTPAGSALYERSRPLLDGAQAAIAAARIAGGEPAALTVGYVAPLTHRRMAATLERYAAQHPEVEVTLHFGSFLDPRGGLREGHADVATLYGEFEHDGLEREPLFTEERGVLLAADHPLAAQREVSVDQFVEAPLVDVPIADRVCRDFWTAAPLRAGRPPRLAASVTTLDALVEAVGAVLGVAATVPSVVDAMGAHDRVVYRPVPGLAPLRFWIAWRSGDERPTVRDFVATALAVRDAESRASAVAGAQPATGR
jgi:DNA-binding transcriptional LysR family regulator